jgi:pimeloyl-ACP methyl ester carboxylesterase
MSSITEKIESFRQQYGKVINVLGNQWTYYSLGKGSPIFWLTGAIRRTSLGYAFMECIASEHRIITPDYASVMRYAEMESGFVAILEAEKVERYILAGQSYGGLLAQSFLVSQQNRVERLILSSSSPADFKYRRLFLERIAIGLIRILPEQNVKALFRAGLRKYISTNETERNEWQQIIREIFKTDLTQAAIMSHFTVTADIMRQHLVRPERYKEWQGKVIVLRSSNDTSQKVSHLKKYEKLFEKSVRIIEMGDMGHTALMFDPRRYADILLKALRVE